MTERGISAIWLDEKAGLNMEAEPDLEKAREIFREVAEKTVSYALA